MTRFTIPFPGVRIDAAHLLSYRVEIGLMGSRGGSNPPTLPAPGDDDEEMAPSSPMEIITSRAPAVSMRRVSVCEEKAETTLKLEIAKLHATYNLK